MAVPADAAPDSPTLDAVRRVVQEALHLRHAVARRAGLSQSELVALEHLVDGPAAPSELARALDVTTAASTGVVDRLEGRHHVERRPHPADRRRTDVHLTESGREEITGHLMPMLVRLAALDDALDETERAVVMRFLDGVAEAFRAGYADPTDS